MMTWVESEAVHRRRWLSAVQFADLLGIAQSSPGVLAVNMAVGAGYRLRGVRGSLTAALGVILPSFVIMLCIAMGLARGLGGEWAERILMGVRPAAVALIAVPALSVARAAGVTIRTAAVPIAAALLIWIGGVSPVCIVLAAVAGGIAAGGAGALFGQKK